MKKNNLEALLEAILKNENYVNEEVPITLPTNSASEMEPDSAIDASLDAVIDRYIVRYERESIPTTNTYENQLFNEELEDAPEYVEPSPMGEGKLEETLKFVLNEQEKDEEQALDLDPDAENEEDAFADDDIGMDNEEDASQGQQQPPSGEPVMQTPQINLNDFAMSIARLVNNFDTLLNPKEVILQRVQKYIQMNYNNRTAKEFMDILDQNYSLRTFDKEEASQEELPTPYAAGALSTEG